MRQNTNRKYAMKPSDVRLNVRLTGRDAADFQNLLKRSGNSVSDVMRDALREYRSHRIARKPDPVQLLAGFVGAGEGPKDLSLHYKQYLSEGLAHKLRDGGQPTS